ncbi:MAG TPA: bifunctional DNA primase/polymerase, partial [Lacipirellulaceae bacterium]|nr:bifunctional DNA primase/polymerase [Lacipirellulaceae bacterium]
MDSTTPQANGHAGGAFDLDQYRQELKDAAADLLRQGFRVVVSEGKNPGHRLAMGDDWQNQRLTLEQAERLINRCPHPCIGLQLGDAVDCDVDGADEDKAYRALFSGGDSPCAPTADTGRDGGTRQLWATDPRIAALDAATITFKAAGGKVTIRTGGKGAYSVLPPSRHANEDKATGEWQWTGRRYRWRDGLAPDSVGLPKLPDIVVQRLLATHQAKGGDKPKGGGGVHLVSLAAMLAATKKQTDGEDGSKRLYTVACRAVEHNLTDGEALATIRAYESQRPFPKEWSDAEIVERVRQAEKEVKRGSAVVIANYSEVEVESDGGDEGEGDDEPRKIIVPKPLA